MIKVIDITFSHVKEKEKKMFSGVYLISKQYWEENMRKSCLGTTTNPKNLGTLTYMFIFLKINWFNDVE